MEQLRTCVRDIPDFPKPGILFRDITPLLKDPGMLRLAVRMLVDPYRSRHLTMVAACEARGFLFGSLAALELGVGFIPLRKKGKLPGEVFTEGYDSEYSQEELEIHCDALQPSDRVLLVDDLIATGGTAAAACDLIERLGAEIVACVFVIELCEFNGRTRLGERSVRSLLQY